MINKREFKRIKFDLTNLFDTKIGEENGVSEDEINKKAIDFEKFFDELKQERANGCIPCSNVLSEQNAINIIKPVVKQIKNKYDNLLIIGIGGSTLGFRALSSALCHPYYNLLAGEKRDGCPRVFVLDNADPEEAEKLLDIIDLEKTCLTYISKTGATPEPAANFLFFIEKIRPKIDQKDLIIISDPGERGINKIAKEFGCKNYNIPPNLPGRFSVLSPVGLFPAEMAGINTTELINGALYMDEFIFNTEIRKNPIYLIGLINYLLDKKGKKIHALMPYSGSLFQFGLWFIQLWAESLGKRLNKFNEVVNTGTTPILALGATDQHSQLQLFKEGPNDKIICFVSIEKYGKEALIKKQFEYLNEYNYFGNHTLAELISVEQKATELSLTNAKRPNYNIILPEINPFTMGQLIYFFEILIVFISKLYGINPFDQPGVEEGKIITYSLMGRDGYQDMREEFLSKISGETDFLF